MKRKTNSSPSPRPLLTAALGLTLLGSPLHAHEQPAPKKEAPPIKRCGTMPDPKLPLVTPLDCVACTNLAPIQTKVQIAILLDTSSSMSGLIDQAKSQLWKVVNTFNTAKKDGQVPFVEVALYEYGNDRLDSGTYWIRQIQPLTRDLDQISEELFSLNTGGGSEFCGAVISRATADLKWDQNPSTYKAIFIAGNEAFTQGPIDAVASCKKSIENNITVNTIHCGNYQTGVNGGWQKGALLTEGTFNTIDQDQAIVHIKAPQDEIILKLNIELNKTYIPYGAQGHQKLESQTRQDSNASKVAKSGAAIQRATTKSSVNYWNGNWDLCDASKDKKFDWKNLKKETLPKELQSKSTEEIQKHVATKKNERVQIQKKIQDANKARLAYVAKERTKLATASTGKQTLDQAIQSAVKAQAQKKGYTFN